MSVRSSQSVTVEFVTSSFTTGAAANADSLPTGTLVVNGTDNGASVTVTNVDTGRYKAAVTLPTLAIGDIVELLIAATVGGVAGKAVVWRDTKDVSLDSNGKAAATLASGDVSGNLPADTKAINAVSTSAVTTVNANVGTTQPTNFVGSGSSAFVKVDIQSLVGDGGAANLLASLANNAYDQGNGVVNVNLVHWQGDSPDALVGGLVPVTAQDAGATATGQIADKLLGRNLAGGSDGGRDVRDALRFLRNRWARTDTGLTVYQEDDSTPAWTSVLVSSSSASPVTSSDPG
jgi:hypothetical protein